MDYNVKVKAACILRARPYFDMYTELGHLVGKAPAVGLHFQDILVRLVFLKCLQHY